MLVLCNLILESTHRSDVTPFDSLDKFVCEELNMSFSKFVLGVHKKAPNTAVKGKLARLPLGSDIIPNILLYANNLEHKIKSPLLREVYIVFLQINNKKSWCHKTLKLKQFLQQSGNVINFTNRKSIKLQLRKCA